MKKIRRIPIFIFGITHFKATAKTYNSDSKIPKAKKKPICHQFTQKTLYKSSAKGKHEKNQSLKPIEKRFTDSFLFNQYIENIIY